MPKKQVYSADGNLKRCSKCDTLKPLDRFHCRKLKSGGFGPTSWCKDCQRTKAQECANAKYRNNHAWREKKLAADRAYGLVKRAEHRALHPKVVLTDEERLERKRASYRKYYTTAHGKAKHRIVSQNRRALLKAKAQGVPLTQSVWDALVLKYDGACAYCKVKTPYLELDHVVPISRGGAHTEENFAAACRACNTSKNNALLSEWTPPTEPQPIQRSSTTRTRWKLTLEQVLEIRARCAAGESQQLLAVEYGVRSQHISDLYRQRPAKPRSKPRA